MLCIRNKLMTIDHPHIQFKLFKGGVYQKLTSAWKGPYTIVRKLSDVTYMLQKGLRSDPFASHVDKLKKYNGQSVPRWYQNHINKQQH